MQRCIETCCLHVHFDAMWKEMKQPLPLLLMSLRANLGDHSNSCGCTTKTKGKWHIFPFLCILSQRLSFYIRVIVRWEKAKKNPFLMINLNCNMVWISRRCNCYSMFWYIQVFGKFRFYGDTCDRSHSSVYLHSFLYCSQERKKKEKRCQ